MYFIYRHIFIDIVCPVRPYHFYRIYLRLFTYPYYLLIIHAGLKTTARYHLPVIHRASGIYFYLAPDGIAVAISPFQLYPYIIISRLLTAVIPIHKRRLVLII